MQKIRQYKVKCVENGIYHVHGDFIPIQIIVTTQLGKKENLWLKGLADKIKENSLVEGLLEAYKGNKKNPLYKSVMNIIVRANKEKFEEVRKGMCEALEELFADEIEEIVKIKVKERVEQALKTAVDEAIKAEIKIGEERVNDLIAKLLEQNRLDDIEKVVKNQAYQNKLFEEFGL